MRKVNTNNMEELAWASPKGKFAGAGKQVSEALGRKPFSTDLMERHPFDVEICRIPPGKAAYPYHTHSAQRSEEHTSELQSRPHLVCRLLLEKKNNLSV